MDSEDQQVSILPYHYEKDVRKALLEFVPRTRSLNVDIRRDPKGEGWLLQRATMHEARNGRFDMVVNVYSSSGVLLAIASQVTVLVPSERRKGAPLL